MPARKTSSTSTPSSSRSSRATATKPAPSKRAAVRVPAATKTGLAKTAGKKAAPAKAAAAKTPAKAPAKAPARPATKGAAAKAVPAPARPRTTGRSPREEPPAVLATPDEQKRLEGRLLEERTRLLKELGYLEANVLKQNPRDSSGDLSGYSFHMADAGTDAMEREKAFLFASSEGRALHDVNEALRRLYKGEYGLCESCGLPISPQRLDVVPHARLCIKCKEREEKAGRR